MKKILLYCMIISLAACKQTPEKQKQAKQQMNTFEKVEWMHNTNVYEVNVRQYTKEGTFKAFATHIPRLKEMGVKTLWFMPITPIASSKMKGSLGSQYAASDYTSINPEFGTLQDFKDLVQQAHAAGMHVIIDWVANHTGWNHTWTKTHPKYYLKDSATADFKIASGMDDIIELDFGNPELRKAMIAAMEYWVKETDIDGYRCDLAAWVEQDFWLQARTALQPVKKLFWLGEFDPTENKDYMQVFDAAYTWRWMHTTEDFYKKQLSFAVLDTLLHEYDTMLPPEASKLWFTTNHDENSWNGTEYEKYGAMTDLLTVFSYTWDGIPLTYSGQELPNNKRLQFFEKDTIEWSGTFAKASLYQVLNKLRNNETALRTSDNAAITKRLQSSDSSQHTLLYLRKNGASEVITLLNFGANAVEFKLPSQDILSGNYSNAFKGGEIVSFVNGDATIRLEPWGYKVFKK